LVGAALLGRRTVRLAGDKGAISSWEIISLAWPFLLANLSLLFSDQAGLWIVAMFCSSADVAIYGAAARLVILIVAPLSVVNAFVPPLIAEFYTRNKLKELERGLRSTATVAALPALIVLLAFVLCGRLILRDLYGEFYQKAAPV